MSVSERLKEMLREIIEKRAPYSQDKVQMAVNGFEQHSKYAQQILTYLEELEGRLSEANKRLEAIRKLVVDESLNIEIDRDCGYRVDHNRDVLVEKIIAQLEGLASSSDSGMRETLAVMKDKKLMKAIRKARKDGSKSSPYVPLTEKGSTKEVRK